MLEGRLCCASEQEWDQGAFQAVAMLRTMLVATTSDAVNNGRLLTGVVLVPFAVSISSPLETVSGLVDSNQHNGPATDPDTPPPPETMRSPPCGAQIAACDWHSGCFAAASSHTGHRPGPDLVSLCKSQPMTLMV